MTRPNGGPRHPVEKRAGVEQLSASELGELSFTRKNAEAKSMVEVKQEQTRVRRLAKVMDVLKNGKKWTG